jgi:hypothetical protein
MINIYQLVIGTVSVEIQDCIISVMRFFSDKKKFKHIIVKELPEEILKYGNSNIRNLSDFWKISLLSTKPNSLIIVCYLTHSKSIQKSHAAVHKRPCGMAHFFISSHPDLFD